MGLREKFEQYFLYHLLIFGLSLAIIYTPLVVVGGARSQIGIFEGIVIATGLLVGVTGISYSLATYWKANKSDSNSN